MPEFQQQIVFQGIDNVSKTVSSIMGEIDTLDKTTASLDQRFAAVSRTGAVFANKLKYIAVAATGVATAAFWLAYRTSDAAESLLNLSEKTGVSVEELQKLNYVADQSNVGAQNLAMGFRFLNRAIAEGTTDSSSEAAAAFQGLGINLKNTSGQVKSTEEVFYELSDAFARGADGPNKVTAAVNLLGRAGEGLIPILNRGSDALRKQGNNFTKFGNQIDKDGLKAIADFNDTVDNLTLTFKGLGSVVAQSLIPILQPLTTGFAEWVASNRELIRMKVTDWVQGVQTAFTNFLPKLESAFKTFMKFWDAIGGFEGILKGLAAFMAADLLVSFANFAAAVAMLSKVLAVSPIGRFVALLGLVGAAVTALNVAFPELGDTVSKVVDRMFDMLGGFFDWFWQKVQGVLEALHLIDKETNKKTEKGTLTTVVNPETGKATTMYNNTGLPTQTDYTQIAPGTQSTAGVNPGGPLDGLWKMLSGERGGSTKPMEINVKLDTANEVSYVDIDAPLTANVTVNSGPMISY